MLHACLKSDSSSHFQPALSVAGMVSPCSDMLNVRNPIFTSFCDESEASITSDVLLDAANIQRLLHMNKPIYYILRSLYFSPIYKSKVLQKQWFAIFPLTCNLMASYYQHQARSYQSLYNILWTLAEIITAKSANKYSAEVEKEKKTCNLQRLLPLAACIIAYFFTSSIFPLCLLVLIELVEILVFIHDVYV